MPKKAAIRDFVISSIAGLPTAILQMNQLPAAEDAAFGAWFEG
jgi:hypothetical protein